MTRRRSRFEFVAFLYFLVAVAVGASACIPSGPAALSDEGADPLLDNPYKEENHSAIFDYLDKQIVTPQPGGQVFSAYHILGSSANRIYVWAVCQECSKRADGSLEKGTGVSLPVVLLVEVRDGLLCVTGHKCPRDGTLYSRDVKDLFPGGIQHQVFGIQQTGVVRDLQSRCESRAREKLGIVPPPPEWRFLTEGSNPGPEFAALLEAEIYRHPQVDPLSPDGRYILADEDGLVALPLFPGGSPVDLYVAGSSLSSDDVPTVRPIGWASGADCLFVVVGLQKDGPHKGSRGAALFRGSVQDGETVELAYFDWSHGLLQGIAWDAASRKVYLHVSTAIWEMDMEGGDARQLRSGLPTYDGLFRAIPSPDGTKFAYNHYLPGKTSLTIFDNRTGKETSIPTGGDSYSFSPLWSPDSRYLVAYLAGKSDVLPDEDGPYPAAKTLMVYDTVGGSTSLLRAEDKWLVNPVWAPDSGTLYFMSASIRLEPDPPMPDLKWVQSDSLWAATPGSGEVQKVSDLASIRAGDIDHVVSAYPVLARPGARGVVLQVSGSESGSTRLWDLSPGAEPTALLTRGSTETYLGGYLQYGTVAAETTTEQGSVLWLLREVDGIVCADKVADLGPVDGADIVACTEYTVAVVLRDSETDVRALAVYRLQQRP